MLSSSEFIRVYKVDLAFLQTFIINSFSDYGYYTKVQDLRSGKQNNELNY